MTDTADTGPDEIDEVEPEPEPELVHGVPVSWSRGQRVLHPSREQLRDVVSNLRDDGYLMCLDVTAVDYLTHPGRALPPGIEPERFEVVVTLISHRDRDRVRLRVQVPAADPTCPSLFALHPGTEALERETYDMFGITFDDHPDMTRILMPEDWVGHPLRKDYDSGRIPVQFKGAPVVR
jgi:NADH:ubiquinone oxidoreductase subunit C